MANPKTTTTPKSTPQKNTKELPALKEIQLESAQTPFHDTYKIYLCKEPATGEVFVTVVDTLAFFFEPCNITWMYNKSKAIKNTQKRLVVRYNNSQRHMRVQPVKDFIKFIQEYVSLHDKASYIQTIKYACSIAGRSLPELTKKEKVKVVPVESSKLQGDLKKLQEEKQQLIEQLTEAKISNIQLSKKLSHIQKVFTLSA